uniref:Arrestin-like N-terminal domain-containing protein n=1 Tax=Mycena chlorophos TaxID=658473 RepID=A0ABQ0LYV5_MYCCL|nr:predicted protein [Mycena chlorophos]
MSLVAVPALPSYSPSPSYASLSRSDEETVEFTPRAGRLEPATGTKTRTWRDLTVIFKNQSQEQDADESDRDIPSYGNRGVVLGELGIENPETVVCISMKVCCARPRDAKAEVAMQLDGEVHLSSTDTGSMTQKVVEERRVLFDLEKNHGRACPTVVGFGIPIPMTYKDNDKLYRTPPSYETICLGSPLVVVRCRYKLAIKVTRSTARRLSLRKISTKSYTTPIIFRPRTRPARPMIAEPSFLTTFKASPAEYHQNLITIPIRKTIVTVEPFIIPSVQTFCYKDEIPFHIQLCGSRTSLALFYGTITPESLQQGKKPRKHNYSAVVRVFLARQIYLDDINGRQSWRTMTVGEAKVRPVVPSFHDAFDASEVSLNWEGEVKPKRDVTCPSFSCAHLLVKDFIILALTPANVRANPLLPVQHAHGIRLVTDGWVENEAHPDDH